MDRRTIDVIITKYFPLLKWPYDLRISVNVCTRRIKVLLLSIEYFTWLGKIKDPEKSLVDAVNRYEKQEEEKTVSF